MMIFADKLIELRKKNGWSQEELAEKLEVSRQTVSKWEGAQSVPDLGRMLKLSELFGVTTDCLMKDELELEPAAREREETVEPDGTMPLPVSMEEATEYLRLRWWMAGWVALGVALCILSPVTLILLNGGVDAGVIHMTNDAAVALGCVVLFLLVAAGVGLFIYTGMRLKKYEDWERMPLDTAYGVDGMIRNRMEKYAPTHTRQLVIGVLLCVLCVVPLFLVQALLPTEWNMLTGVAALLVFVAVGVERLVQTGIRWSTFDIVLETGSYTREMKLENRRNGLVAGIYWSAVTAGYLLWSFLSSAWDRTWIVWPIAGICYGILTAILQAVRRSRAQSR